MKVWSQSSQQPHKQHLMNNKVAHKVLHKRLKQAKRVPEAGSVALSMWKLVDMYNEFRRSQQHSAKQSLRCSIMVLLDSDSSILFANNKLVSSIWPSKTILELTTKGGTMIVKQVADLEIWPSEVWFSRQAMTRVLSLALLNDNIPYQFTDSVVDDVFVVHMPRKDMFRKGSREHLSNTRNGAHRSRTTFSFDDEDNAGYTQTSREGQWRHATWIVRRDVQVLVIQASSLEMNSVTNFPV